MLEGNEKLVWNYMCCFPNAPCSHAMFSIIHAAVSVRLITTMLGSHYHSYVLYTV